MIARDGLRFVIPMWLLTAIMVVLWLSTKAVWLLLLGVMALICAAFVSYFFRDPERTPPEGDDLILSPGDGKVILIEERTNAQGGTYTLVSIFLSVFNVHVNRIPVSGRVAHVEHKPGRFYKAFERQAVTENERTEIAIESPLGSVRFSQVAGILARRIVCHLQGDEVVRKGERFGLIRFGSRIDLYLGKNVRIDVAVGDRVKGGESIVGAFTENR